MLKLRGLRQCTLLMLVATGSWCAFHPVTPSPFHPISIRIVVPDPAGNAAGHHQSVVAAELAEAERWRMLIENRPGALQTIGMSEVLKQPADGYSIYPMSVPTMVVPSLLPHLGLRPDVTSRP